MVFDSAIALNAPALWRAALPRKGADGHKYDSGLALIYAAPEMTGATRLAAEACARVGAGLVNLLSPLGVSDLYRACLPAHIIVRSDPSWHDSRATARLYGPGGLPCAPDFSSSLSTVLDADALADLPDRLGAHYVLTPHEGEFARAFFGIQGAREERARAAARGTGAHIVLKGPRTVIAAPDGRCVLNDHASPHLATAGTGDVLAGMIAGLLARAMAPFEAACAAVWMHGECARRFGPGLVASDLPGLIPEVLRDFQ